MKKLIYLLAFAFVFAGGSMLAQNELNFKVKLKSQAVGEVTVAYADGTQESLQIGGKGKYNFAIGKQEVLSITINGVTCKIGEEVSVHIGDEVVAVRLLESIQDEGKGFSSLIR